MLAFIDGRWLSVQPEQVVDGGLRGADGVLDGERHVVRKFAELASEGQVRRSFGPQPPGDRLPPAAGTELRIARGSPLLRFGSTRQVLRVCVGGDLSRSGHQLLGLLDHFCFLRVHSLSDFSSLAGVRHVSPI